MQDLIHILPSWIDYCIMSDVQGNKSEIQIHILNENNVG